MEEAQAHIELLPLLPLGPGQGSIRQGAGRGAQDLRPPARADYLTEVLQSLPFSLGEGVPRSPGKLQMIIVPHRRRPLSVARQLSRPPGLHPTTIHIQRSLHFLLLVQN